MNWLKLIGVPILLNYLRIVQVNNGRYVHAKNASDMCGSGEGVGSDPRSLLRLL